MDNMAHLNLSFYRLAAWRAWEARMQLIQDAIGLNSSRTDDDEALTRGRCQDSSPPETHCDQSISVHHRFSSSSSSSSSSIFGVDEDESDEDTIMSPAISEEGKSSSEASTSAGNSLTTTITNAVQGAKRRKPQKTSKITQQQQYEANLNENDFTCVDSPAPPSDAEEIDAPPPGSDPPLHLEPIIPPGPIPTPIISSTTVVTSNGDNIYRCPHCQENLKSQKDFTTHIRGHNEVKPHPDPNDPTGQAKVYYCCLCGKMLSSFSSLDRHMLVHSGERPFSCELCGQTFTTNGNMHRHKRTHSAKELQEYGEAMGISMTTSGKRGGRKKKVPVAKLTKVAEEEDKEAELMHGNTDGGDDPSVRTSNCPKCSKSFFTDNILEAHIHSAHAGEEFKCDQCSFTFLNYSMLQMHRLFHNSVSNAAAAAATSAISSSPSPSQNDFSPQHYPQLAKAILANEVSTYGRTSSAFPDQQQRIATSSSRGRRRQQRKRRTVGGPGPGHGDQDDSSALSRLSPQPLPTFTLPRPESPSNGQNRACSDKNDDDGVNDDHDEDEDVVEDSSSQRDLADVRSIISTTNLNGASSAAAMDKDEDDDDDDDHESETSSNDDTLLGSHDDNDPLIKDMKLKGEFPCRLCPAIYPNLRALKGHNKEHLNKAPYLCNVGTCTYSSSDKSTLTRHMRTHTGEKPYECKLCNYGFTTKANCERHLKNKHGKTSRDQIRDNLMIHETEETLAAGEVGPGAGGGGSTSGGSSSSSSSNNGLQKIHLDAQREAGNFRCKVCKQLFASSDNVITHAIKEHPAYASDAHHIFEELKGRGSGGGNSFKNALGDLHAPSMVPRISHYPPTSQLLSMLPMPAATQPAPPPAFQLRNAEEEDTPLDLSRPSKSSPHRGLAGNPTVAASAPQLLESHLGEELLKSNAAAAAMSMGLFPHFMFPSNSSAAARSGTGAAAAAPSFPFPFHPAFMNFLPAGVSNSFQLELKQRLHMQQQQQQQMMAAAVDAAAVIASMSHPSILQSHPLAASATVAAAAAAAAAAASSSHVNAARSLQSPPPSLSHPIGHNVDVAAAFIAAKQEVLRKQQQGKKKTLAVEETFSSAAQKLQASNDAHENGKGDKEAADGNNSDSDSNYKMVIQNGILMKKQKQRRYRTERPYGCNYCNARFTLRSNMERHIKQQHPEHWSSKPRGSRRNHSATVPTLAPQFRGERRDVEESKREEEDEEEEEEEVEEEGDEEEEEERQDNEEEEEEKLNGSADKDNDKLSIAAAAASADDSAMEEKADEENGVDLASVSKLLNTASTHTFKHFFENDDNCDEDDEEEERGADGCCGEDEEMISSDGDGTNRERKMSAYSAAPHKISCPFCTRKFPWTSSLKRHILTHTGMKPFKCLYCPLLFTTKSNCDRHQVRKHGASTNNNDQAFTMRNVPDRPFKCKTCPSSTFSSERNLLKHQYSKHLNMEYPGGNSSEGDDEDDEEDEEDEREEGLIVEVTFKCHLCDESFPDRSEAIGHLQISHAEDYESLVNDNAFSESCNDDQENEEDEEVEERPAENGQQQQPPRSIVCMFCMCRFLTSEGLQRHVLQHTSPASALFACDICHKRFSLKQSLLRHRKKHDSGVSSDGSSDSGSDDVSIVKEGGGKGETLKKMPPKTDVAKRKRASLMDTIEKLSSAKKTKPSAPEVAEAAAE